MSGINFKRIRRRLLTKTITDFIKYYPETLDGDTCDLIVLELQTINLDHDLVANSTRKNGIRNSLSFLFSININEEDHPYVKVLADAITKGKNQYLEDQPKYKRLYKASAGETFGIYEDVGSKLLIQYYPTEGNMGEHIDTGADRNYMKNNLEIDTEYCHAQLSCLLFLNDDYEGGTFVGADQEYKTERGSSLYFPSSFMFPHKVNTVTKGKRWSCAAWLR